MTRQLQQTMSCVLLVLCLSLLSATLVPQITHSQNTGIAPVPQLNGLLNLTNPSTPAPAPAPGTVPALPSGIDGGVYAGAVAAGGNPGGVVEEVPPLTLGNPIYDLLYSFVLTVFGSLFGWAGNLMSYGMNNFVLGFGTQYFDNNVGVAVESVWEVVRDLFNLTFIFGLVYIGFKMILDSSDSQARSMLIHLIGAALLVNFSLFIVKFVIDLANITAIVIAKAGFNGQDIANSFINLINFSTMLNISNEEFALFGAGGAFAYIFGLMIFLATAAFVFAAAGILFIVRFVVLNIYLVFSPILFIGWVFPSLKQESSKFWNGLLGNAFFAPAYLMMIYLSFQVLSRYKLQIGEVNYASLFKAEQTSAETLGAAGIIPFFILAMVFMVLSLVVAKKMGAVGASTAISIGNKLRGGVQGAMSNVAWGAAGLAYRNTGGRASKGLLNVMDRSGFSNLPGTRTLRSVVKSGYEYGAGGTGLAKTRSDIEAEEADIIKNRSRMVKETKKKDRDKKIAAGGDEMQEAAAGLSSSDLESMTEAQRLAIAPYVTASTAEDFGKSEKVDAGAISEFKKTRSEYIEKSIGQGNDLLTSEFSKLSIAQLESVSSEFIMANAEHLTQDQMKAIKGSKKFAEGRVKNIENTRRSRFTSGAGFEQTYTHYDANNVATTKSRARDTKEIAAMPTSALTSTSNAQYMNASVLRELEKNTNLTLANKVTIAQNVLQDPTGNQDGRNYLATTKVINDGNWG